MLLMINCNILCIQYESVAVICLSVYFLCISTLFEPLAISHWIRCRVALYDIASGTTHPRFNAKFGVVSRWIQYDRISTQVYLGTSCEKGGGGEGLCCVL